MFKEKDVQLIGYLVVGMHLKWGYKDMVDTEISITLLGEII